MVGDISYFFDPFQPFYIAGRTKQIGGPGWFGLDALGVCMYGRLVLYVGFVERYIWAGRTPFLTFCGTMRSHRSG